MRWQLHIDSGFFERDMDLVVDDEAELVVAVRICQGLQLAYTVKALKERED